MKIKASNGEFFVFENGRWIHLAKYFIKGIIQANEKGLGMPFIDYLVKWGPLEVDDLSLSVMASEPPPLPRHPIEANGAANIVLHIRTMKHLGRQVDVDYIEKEALMTAEYMHQLQGSSPLQWHEFVKKFEEGK